LALVVMRILVSGASGFVGHSVCRLLASELHSVTALVRRPIRFESNINEWVYDGVDFEGIDLAWPMSLRIDAVIHCAARVHMMGSQQSNALEVYRAINVKGSLLLAHAAFDGGARRFVFVSSVKALGDREPGRPYREMDQGTPEDPYGISKWEAEQALIAMGRETGMEIVVVRPPLVYGPEVRANFFQLLSAVSRGMPLPFGAIDACRSMVYLENLSDALRVCAIDPRASSGIFHVRDAEDLTVPEMVRRLARDLHVQPRLFHVPVPLLQLVGRLTGRSAQVARLVSPLRLDSNYIREQLGWHPPHSVDQGLMETANWYRSL
jgi:nucleoside-diphosphate-sugar epimerase